MRGGAWDPVVLTRSQVQVHRPKQNGKAVGGPLAWQCRLEHDPIGNCTHCYLGWTDHNRQFFFSISRLALLIYVFIYFTVKSSAGLVVQDKTCGKEWHKVSMTEYRLEKWEREKQNCWRVCLYGSSVVIHKTVENEMAPLKCEKSNLYQEN